MEGGLRHVPEDDLLAARARAIDAIAAVLEELGLGRVSERPENASVLVAHGSDETDTFTPAEVAGMNAALRERAHHVRGRGARLGRAGF